MIRRSDNTPIDPDVAEQLAAIDATLAGEPVDPRHADVAELALLLVDGRPTPTAEFTRSLDARVERRFARPAAGDAGEAGAPARGGAGGGRRASGRWLAGLGGLAAAAVGVIVAVVVIGSAGSGGTRQLVPAVRAPGASGVASEAATASGGGSASASTSSATSAATTSAPSGATSTAASSAGAAAGAASAPGPSPRKAASAGALGTFGAGQGAAQGAAQNGGAQHNGAPQPVPNGRKIVQSAQLALTAPATRIDDVAQEIFDVVGRENGYVNSSNVSAGAGAYAEFELSIPSSALGATMTALSQLQYAHVSSRTDATQDVNGQYLNDVHRLADDRALRTALLKQLAAASTQAEIDSLNAQIRDAEASVRSDQATLNSLTHAIDFSHVTVTIGTPAAPVAPVHHSGGFTLGTAAHDAGRVLTVAAGVGLIALAALLPVALVAALLWWVGSRVQRRRREQALDLA